MKKEMPRNDRPGLRPRHAPLKGEFSMERKPRANDFPALLVYALLRPVLLLRHYFPSWKIGLRT